MPIFLRDGGGRRGRVPPRIFASKDFENYLVGGGGYFNIHIEKLTNLPLPRF
jgi:hypothetical protein